jgi:hypothetical protein
MQTGGGSRIGPPAEIKAAAKKGPQHPKWVPSCKVDKEMVVERRRRRGSVNASGGSREAPGARGKRKKSKAASA